MGIAVEKGAVRRFKAAFFSVKTVMPLPSAGLHLRRMERSVAVTVDLPLWRIMFNKSLTEIMPDKSGKSSRSRFIRWTGDEWTQIASHLYAQQGAGTVSSFNFGEMKARDVFLAQDVLPIDRHRKLISIAQGFDGIRARLGAVIERLPQACQEDLFQMRFLEGGRGRNEQDSSNNSNDQTTERVRRLQAHTDTNEVTVAIGLEPQAAYEASVTIPANADQGHRTSDIIAGVAEPAVEQTFMRNLTQEGQFDGSRLRAPVASSMPAPVLAAASLIELARPFVAMVCEEIARALLCVISTQGPGHGMHAGIRKASIQEASSQQAALHDGTEWQSSSRPGSMNQNQAAAADNNFRPAHSGAELDENSTGPSEFDPKLPPSEDRTSGPIIGLVGTHANDFEDLRQLYPQLRLTIAQADTISDVRMFGHCQRIIALRDEVPLVLDELLARLLRHRYIRLTGGVDGVMDQLNAWLDAPGSITAAPRRPAPRNGKEFDHGPGEK